MRTLPLVSSVEGGIRAAHQRGECDRQDLSMGIRPRSAKFRKATDLGGQVFVSSIALFELSHGVAKSSRRDFNKKRLETFFAGPIHPLSFEDQDAEIAGVIRADLESIGKPIGAYDLLIAGQAIRNKLTLITANLSEFARIKELAWADWGRP
jgi:tRNA(fMet)-specific endonuclease VapC